MNDIVVRDRFSKDSVPLLFFVIGFFLFSVDGIPYIKYTDYKPISVIFFGISIFLLMTRKGFRLSCSDTEKILLSFVFYSVLHSLLVALQTGDVKSSIEHILSLFVGLIIYFSIISMLSNFRKLKQFERAFNLLLVLTFALPIIFGILQILGLLSGASLVNMLTSFFVSRTYGRVQMLSNEPSWAAIHILVGIILFNYYRKSYISSKVFFYLLVILFIFTFSMNGYVVLLITVIFYLLIKRRIKPLFLLFFSIFLFVVMGYVINLLDLEGYYTYRFNFREYYDFDRLLHSDGSVFVRVVFPIIGLIQFLKNPIWGVGGGFYYLDFARIIQEQFSYGLSFYEVYFNAFVNPSNANPRNLIAKILAEEGIIGFVLFSSFLFKIFTYCKSDYSKFIFCFSLAMVMNFDSYAFVDFWMMLAFLRSRWFEQENRDGVI
ncbi:O-antigen ligase family protein [Geobacillus stearothermophilus]|uniref:O-antigen ligase family protein n=1 Tax=Geobacillus stearothermophilus TaxID=1422 RepID=UPI002E20A12D|nr:O-antigen ligase family protein [Geobacillus stearothermophilus]MED3752118.1 O-antigen ligase family protein [Geobacillus stearothermophilus]